VAWPDYTYDLFEDAEDSTLASGMSEIDTAGKLTLASTAQYYEASHAHQCVHGSDTTVDYLEYEFTPAVSKVSIGLWYRTSTPGAWSGGPAFIEVIQTGVATLARLADQRSGGTNNRQICPYGNDTYVVNCADSTWYWITLYYENGANMKFRVYDTSHNLVGSEQECDPLADANAGTIRIGATFGDTNQSGAYSYLDGIVIDKTDATFPLLGWETAAGGGGKPTYAYAQQ